MCAQAKDPHDQSAHALCAECMCKIKKETPGYTIQPLFPLTRLQSPFLIIEVLLTLTLGHPHWPVTNAYTSPRA